MAHNPAWHAEYLILENAEAAARETYRAARGAKKAAALDALRVAGQARWDFEMAATQIVDAATLTPREFFAGMLPTKTREG